MSIIYQNGTFINIIENKLRLLKNKINNLISMQDHGVSDTTFTLTPNTFHVWDEVSSLTLTFAEISGIANKYLFQFTSGSKPTKLILPDNIKFNSDFIIEKNKTYQISILNRLGIIMSWDNISGDNKYHSKYFTIEALEDGLTVNLSESENASYYRIDNGEWISLNANTTTPSINSGQKISFKITNPIIASYGGIGTFIVNKAFNVEGNIMSLLYGDNFDGQIDLTGKDYAFQSLFSGCKTLQSAKNLILPATTLASSCYSQMFNGCTSLTTAPELPATTLANNCYNSMFYGCTSLTSAPELPATTLANGCYTQMFQDCTSLTFVPAVLPATTLADWCYSSMFNGCTSLTTAPELPATTLANNCYYEMFRGCYGLTTAPELPATTLANGCYTQMFYGCTSLTSAPELPATTLANGCYYGMFQGCTSLTTAPALPSTTLASKCYYEMFQGCNKLNYIKMLATNISATGCLTNWVSGVASRGTFVKHKNMTSLPSGNNGIPNGWTVENISPCFINKASESITFVYSDGLFTPTNEIIDLSQYFTKEELLSVQPECEITVTLLDKIDNVLALDYVWANDKTLSDVLNELDINKDVYDINVIITKVNAPEDSSYYYYMLDETEFIEKDWMRIVSLEDDNTISLKKDIQYSINGNNWENLYAGNQITVNSDDIVYFKGTNIDNHFTVNKAFNVEGNIMSLIYDNNFEGQVDLRDYAFYELFYKCTTLQNAKNLVLPATTLAYECYYQMFRGCTSLTTAPSVLPATTLTYGCYQSMFQDCTSLTTAPQFLATTLAERCCVNMFSNCTSLVTAPQLPATTLAIDCYRYMFSDCTSLTTAPSVLPATTLAERCYDGMFYGCTSLTTAPELPATTLADSCYTYMFYNCTSLTSAPELPATTLASGCYYGMFDGCSKLNYIKMLATDISASACLSNWVNGVAPIGIFVKHPDMTSLPRSINGIPYSSGWTVQNA